MKIQVGTTANSRNLFRLQIKKWKSTKQIVPTPAVSKDKFNNEQSPSYHVEDCHRTSVPYIAEIEQYSMLNVKPVQQ